MRLNLRESSRIRSGASIASAAVTVLFAAACGSSSTSSDAGGAICSDPGYSPITFYGDGAVGSGLTGCANSDRSQTIISNSSPDTVWYVTSPTGFSYWSAANDLEEFENGSISPTVALFRIGMRSQFNPPLLSIEPGVTATLSTAQGTAIQLMQDPGEQATWEVASLLVDSASDKAQDAIVSLLEDGSTKTDDAMITCMSSGYTIGKNLADAGDSETTIQSQLSSELGIYQATNECGEAIEEAQEEIERAGEAPELKLASVAAETREDEDYADAGRLINEAEDAARDLLKIGE